MNLLDTESAALRDSAFRELAQPFAEVVGPTAVENVLAGVRYSRDGGGSHFSNADLLNGLDVLFSAVSCVFAALQAWGGPTRARREPNEASEIAKRELEARARQDAALQSLLQDGEVSKEEVLRVVRRLLERNKEDLGS